MAVKVFIDGSEGTTGLKIFERFKNRSDIELLKIAEEKRKNPNEREKLINESDFTFLCLPDSAAIESASLCSNPKTVLIDASTAHRTNPEWAYGFPELDFSFREKIAASNKIAVPGCYASGFVALAYPLVKHGILPRDYPISIHAVSGYSGAGKKAIEMYENPERSAELSSPRLYALGQEHKHLPEMTKIPGLDRKPAFNPYVCDYFQGMTVTVALHAELLNGKPSLKNVWEKLKEHYDGATFIKVEDFFEDGGTPVQFIPANSLVETNEMRIFVYGNDERIVLTSQFDNLGKGASGAAVQCMNIRMGIEEWKGLK